MQGVRRFLVEVPADEIEECAVSSKCSAEQLVAGGVAEAMLDAMDVGGSVSVRILVNGQAVTVTRMEAMQ